MAAGTLMPIVLASQDIGFDSKRNGDKNFRADLPAGGIKEKRARFIVPLHSCPVALVFKVAFLAIAWDSKKCKIYGEKSKMSARRHFPQGHDPLFLRM